MSAYSKELITAIMEHDPAARSRMEVRLLYPGYKALMAHRRAAWFHRHGMHFVARWISQRAARKTGIEIHPGAQIGRRVTIDHGMGVVIGETAVVGDGCTIYQGVTLGGTGKDKGKRHPTLGQNVLVGSGAKVLGPFTVGDNARIAAGAVVLSEVPSDATAVGVPAQVVRIAGQRPAELDQIHYDDPVWQELLRLRGELDELKSGKAGSDA
ncbi:MAG: serine O-acetyltransferase [Ruminococcaceae bacterium]|nr:serine O-acetyltransferase [Oscillospiraceae bacterium]